MFIFIFVQLSYDKIYYWNILLESLEINLYVKSNNLIIYSNF